MKKKILIILLITLLTLVGCSNEKVVEEDKAKKVVMHKKETKLVKIEVDWKSKQIESDQAEVKTDAEAEKIQAEPKEQKVEEVNDVIVDTKPVTNNKTSTAPKQEKVKKEVNKPEEKPAVNTKQVPAEKPSEEASLITKTSIPTIDFLLPQQNSEERSTPIKNLVVHFTSNAVLNPKAPYNAQDIRKVFVDYGVSAHYMIGREGEIYLLVPENRIAYHAGKGSLKGFPQDKDQLNKYSIGIEMMAIGTKVEMSSMMPAAVYDSIPQSNIGYTEAQYQTLHKLVNDIVQRNPDIKKDRKHIVGHDEYAPDRKTDPGSLFNWTKIGL